MKSQKTIQKFKKKSPLKEITNTINSKRSTQTQKKISSFKLENIGYQSQIKTKEFYINLKESQLLSLSSSLSLNIETLKCRYRALNFKLKKISNNKNFLHSKLAGLTPILKKTSKNNSELSPISVCESQFSAFSVLNNIKTCDFENKKSYQKFLNFEKLNDQKTKIDEENCKVIEKEFGLKEKKKKIEKSKQILILLFGKLFEKKKNNFSNKFVIGELKKKNMLMQKEKNSLQEKLENIIKNQKIFIKTHQKSEKNFEKIAKFDEEKLRRKQYFIQNLEDKLSQKLKNIQEKESYLFEILTLKNDVFKRIENMKNFDNILNKTKDSTLQTLNKIARNSNQNNHLVNPGPIIKILN